MAATQKKLKPHVVCIPLPAQSHVKAMLKLAELLHHKGLQITFVNTEFVHNSFLESRGPHCLDGLPGFQFKTTPDGVPRSSTDNTATTVFLLLQSVESNFLAPFIDLVTKLPDPPTYIISDGFMSSFTIDAAQKLGIPVMMYWTFAACAFMGFYQINSLIQKGLAPLNDESYLTNGYLDTVIEWVPGMEGIRLKDFPVVWTTDLNDKQLMFSKEAPQRSLKVPHHIIHTFHELEASAIKALSSIYCRVYTIGPLQLLLDQIPRDKTHSEGSNLHGYSLLKEEPECFQWLQSKEPNSVIYVNFGTSTEMSLNGLRELGWGLANSNHYFLWIIRCNLVKGESAVLPPEFEEHIKKRGFIASWCSQEKVLNHPSVGGFLTHCGWGSTIESLSAGVPMICWPFAWDQMTNCRSICKDWGVGVEMGNKLKRDEVSRLVQELMGERGHITRNKAIEWKEKARVATAPNGSSSLNIDDIVKEIMMQVVH